MADLATLQALLSQQLPANLTPATIAYDELTLVLPPAQLLSTCHILRDDAALHFNMLVDVCGVDYLHYGLDEWQTNSATGTGFGRGTTPITTTLEKNRFAVVYHLLSLKHNHRVRLRVPLVDTDPAVDSVMPIWPSANWYEREVFDLFGIMFHGHPDLRRILTDYGFVGHPFRKDFPLIGEVEARYDATQKRVVYEPVSIEMRTLEPKVIRHDNRYLGEEVPLAK